jgi:hypothetical protein
LEQLFIRIPHQFKEKYIDMTILLTLLLRCVLPLTNLKQLKFEAQLISAITCLILPIFNNHQLVPEIKKQYIMEHFNELQLAIR